jgi:hypothetical protein
MSQEFQKFSEAARLYAKYSAVVDEMYDAYTADILAFVNALRDQTQLQVRKGKIAEEGKNSYRAWWLDEDDSDDDDEVTDDDTTEGEAEDVPYIYFSMQDPKIVTPGILAVEAHADGALEPYRQQIASALSKIELPPSCKKTARVGNALLAVAISYGDADDPVKLASEPVLAILATLDEAYRKLQPKISNANQITSPKKAK